MPALPPVTRMTLSVSGGMEVLGEKLWGLGWRLRVDLMNSMNDMVMGRLTMGRAARVNVSNYVQQGKS
jgi:hypothetical protein